jgi:hypothetical protein
VIQSPTTIEKLVIGDRLGGECKANKAFTVRHRFRVRTFVRVSLLLLWLSISTE